MKIHHVRKKTKHFTVWSGKFLSRCTAELGEFEIV